MKLIAVSITLPFRSHTTRLKQDINTLPLSAGTLDIVLALILKLVPQPDKWEASPVAWH